MGGELFDFRWRVPVSGYCWVDGEVGAGPAAGEKVRVMMPTHAGAGALEREYKPLAEPALYRTFADVLPTEAALLAFANEWGALGAPEPFNVRLPGRSEPMIGAGGETLFRWEMAVSQVRHAVLLWDMIHERQQALPQHFHVGPDAAGREVILYSSIPVPAGASEGEALCRLRAVRQPDGYLTVRLEVAATVEQQTPLLIQNARRGAFLPAAWAALRRLVNRGLRDGCCPQLVQVAGELRPALRNSAASLIGCLWLQLADAINGNRAPRSCRVCKTWFEVGSGKRTDKEFCSGTCRNRAYRERQEHARQLAAKGKLPREIARELDSDVATVKGWLRTK